MQSANTAGVHPQLQLVAIPNLLTPTAREKDVSTRLHRIWWATPLKRLVVCSQKKLNTFGVSEAIVNYPPPLLLPRLDRQEGKTNIWTRGVNKKSAPMGKKKKRPLEIKSEGS